MRYTLHDSCLIFISDARRRKPQASFFASRLSQGGRWPEENAIINIIQSIMNRKIFINRAYIIKLKFDAIVNAANNTLPDGDGVDGAIPDF